MKTKIQNIAWSVISCGKEFQLRDRCHVTMQFNIKLIIFIIIINIIIIIIIIINLRKMRKLLTTQIGGRQAHLKILRYFSRMRQIKLRKRETGGLTTVLITIPFFCHKTSYTLVYGIIFPKNEIFNNHVKDS